MSVFFIGLLIFIFQADSVFSYECVDPPNLTKCSEDYSVPCENGGTMLCHKRGCSVNGEPGPDCTWVEPDSRCEPCQGGSNITPVQPTDTTCETKSGGEYGSCYRDPDSYCNAHCNYGWNIPTSDPDAECYTVQCGPCTNSRECCRKRIPQPSSTSGPNPTNPPPGSTATPVPTLTPTPRPSSTPTPTPNKQFNPVTVPTTAPRQSGALGSALSMTWKCLKAEKTARSNYGETKLTGEGLPTGADIYIVGCVQGETFYCTTGNDNLDSMLRISKGASGYVFVAKNGNPIKLTSENLSTLVESRTPTVMTHVFYAVYAGDYNNYPGEGGTIQYKRFDMEQDYTKCVAIRWDPYGRVFDSQSLEPIPGINIHISDKNRKNINIPGVINPLTTNPAGFFNFYVEPGEYYLEPESVEGYAFSASPNINPNYNKIYSNLYKPNEPIFEVAGSAQHRDIALDPGFNQPLRNSPKEISFNILPGRGTTQTKVIGEVSHPLTRVELYQETNKIGETIADKFGYYEVLIDNEKIKQEMPIIPKLTKIDLYSSTKSASNKNLVTRIMNYLVGFFKPRSTKADPPKSVTGSSLISTPHYLEGYVYDKNKQIMSGAMVDVIVKMSDQPHYQTITDENGLLIIGPNNLPIFEYYLKITPQNGQTYTMTTYEFINKNKDYLDSNQINLINATKNNLPVAQ